MSNFYFLKFFLLFHIIIKKVISSKVNSYISNNEINPSFNLSSINFSEYENYCREDIYYNTEKCYQESISLSKNITREILSSFNDYTITANLNISINNEILSENDLRHISYIYYNLGNIHYFGLSHLSKVPSLHLGLIYFIISAFFGSPHSKYKLAIILENNLFNQIYQSKDFQKLVNTKSKANKIQEINLFNKISQTEFFQKNFVPLINLTTAINNKNFTYNNKKLNRKEISQKVEEHNNNLAISFLYSSSLQNHLPSRQLMAYKLYKGYSLSYSCTNALKYYLDISKEFISELHKANTKINYDYISIENYEYIGNKFKEENLKDPKSVVDLYWSQITNKKEDINLQIIKELGKIYYYGLSGVEQNFETSFFLFNKAVNLNDNESMFYLGEQYLHGWGIEKNYTKAFELFNKSKTEFNNTSSWNSLGYMYYYGYGVEKNIEKAFEYFTVGITGGDNEAYFDKMFLLLQGFGNKKNNLDKNKIDFDKAYLYATKLASSDISFGNYFYAMMNQYSIGSLISNCDINIGFFKSIAEHSLYNKYLHDLAINFYRNKMLKKAFIIYMELANLGSQTAQINSALILEKYKIFSDKNFQKFMTYKYFLMSYNSGNSLASLKLGDYFYGGFGNLKPNIKQSKKYYKEAKNLNLLVNRFKKAHADFNLGMIYLFKENSTNRTADIELGNKYLNKSEKNEELAFYPSKIIKLYNKIFNRHKEEENIIWKFIKDLFIENFNKTIFRSMKLYFVLISIILYFMFYVSLKYQDE